jgi:hypothetical protein
MTSLVDVQNIPEIEIEYCPALKDFVGLGNNQKLVIKRDANRRFGKFREKNPEIMKTIQEIILV